MRKLHTLVLLGAFAIVPFARAQTDQSTINVTRPVVPSNPHQILASDFRQLRGDYELSTGDILSIRRGFHKYYVEVNDKDPTEVVATASNRFVTVDGKMEIAFKRNPEPSDPD